MIKIGVTLCVLNEELYIGACLRSLIAHPAIVRIAVVENCCKHNEHAGDCRGLSKDNTAKEIEQVICEDGGEKIIYNQYGFSSGKSEVQNYALGIASKGVDYILAVDGDELWHYGELEKLVEFLEAKPKTNAIYVRWINFWKRPDVIRFGGEWDASFVRIFKNLPGIHWNIHDAPVAIADGRRIDRIGRCATPGICFHHYGYLKPKKEVQNKLDYYSKRNGVKIGNAFEAWDESQITTDPKAKEGFKYFRGEHPAEFAKIKFHGEKI